MQRRISRRLRGAGLVAGAALTAFGAIAALPPVGKVPQATLNKTIEAQKRLTTEHPEDAAAWNDLGNLEVLASRPADAEAAYRKAVELDPGRESSLFNLGLLLQQRGEAKEAEKLYRQVLKVDPDNAWAHYQIGAIRERRGDKSAAIEAYAEAFALNPQLGFKEVNPQIVDNRLATEAMLRAYRNQGTLAPSVPTVYDDPRRIREMLVSPPGVEAATSPIRDTGTDTKKTPPAPPSAAGSRVLTNRDLNAVSNSGQATPSGAPQNGMQQPQGAYRIQRPSGGELAPGSGAGFGVPGRGRIPRATQEWRRADPNSPGNTAYPGTVINPGVNQAVPGAPGSPYPPAQGNNSYYRPGVSSTGRIGLLLLPGRHDGHA